MICSKLPAVSAYLNREQQLHAKHFDAEKYKSMVRKLQKSDEVRQR